MFDFFSHAGFEIMISGHVVYCVTVLQPNRIQMYLFLIHSFA